jgi:hypothetical protein
MTIPTPQLDRLIARLSSLIGAATDALEHDPAPATKDDALYAAELAIARSLARWAE